MANQSDNEGRQDSDASGASASDGEHSDASDEAELDIPSPDLPSPSGDSGTSLQSRGGSGAARTEPGDDADGKPVPPPPPNELESGGDEGNSEFGELPETGDIDPVSDETLSSAPDSDGSVEGAERAESAEASSSGSPLSDSDEDAGDGGFDETVPPDPSPEDFEDEREPTPAQELLDRDRDFDTSDQPPGDETDVLEKSKLREGLDDEPSGTETDGGPETEPEEPSGRAASDDALDSSASPSPPDRIRSAAAEDGQLDPAADGDPSPDWATDDDTDPPSPTPNRPESALPEGAVQPTPPLGAETARPTELPQSPGPSEPEESDGEAPPSDSEARGADADDAESGASPPGADAPPEQRDDPGAGEPPSDELDSNRELPPNTFEEPGDVESVDDQGEPEAPPVHADDLGDGGKLDDILERGPWLAAVAGVVLLGTILAAFVSAAAVVTWLDGNRLRRALDETELAPTPDTYRAWVDAYDEAAVGSRESSRPGSFRSKLHWVGDVVGVEPPSAIRRRIRERRAYYAAVLEYRFERHGSRRADSVAKRLFSDDEQSSLEVAAAAYRSLARDRFSEARAQLEGFEPPETHEDLLTDAKFATALAADDAAAVRRVANSISDPETSVYRQYLLARSARYREESSEAEQLLAFIENTAPQHLDARIARVDALHREGTSTEGLEYGDKLRAEQLAGASDYQRSRLHLLLGKIRRARGDVQRARRRFTAAIQAEPERASVYLSLIDFLVDRAELDSARERLDRARTRAGETPVLARSAARLAYLEGDFARTLELTDQADQRGGVPATLRARALLRSDRPDAAVTFLDSLEQPARDAGTVSAWRTVAAYRAGHLESREAIDRAESVVSNHSEKPLVQRAAARLHLDVAREQTGSSSEKHVDRAVDLLKSESLLPIERSLHGYLLCECHLVRREGEQAKRACASGRRINPKFLPGMYTLVRLHVLQGETDEARLLLDGLDRDDEQPWPITELRVRATLRDGEPSKAREELRTWTESGGEERSEHSYVRALIDFHEGNYRGMLQRFENLDGGLRDSPEGKLYRAHALVRTGRNASRAESILKGLNDHARWSPTAWLVFGELRRRQGRTRDALENLEFAENQFTDRFAPAAHLEHLHIERARVWSTTYDWEYRNVESNLREARDVSESSTSPELHLALGEQALERRDAEPESVVEHFRAALQRQPARCAAARGLAKAYREKFDDSEARDKIDSIEPLSSGRCSE